MGDENLRPFVKKQAFRILLAFGVLVLVTWISRPRNKPEPKSGPTPNPVFDKTILIVDATPVDNEPGAYILEYSNGATEILHANGARERLEFKLHPDAEDNPHVQPVRPSPNADQRSGNSWSPD